MMKEICHSLMKSASRRLPLFIIGVALFVGCSQQKAQTGLTVFDIQGQQHNTAEWVGQQPVVLNFWGTWCGPCRKELPDLVRLYEEYSPKGVEMLGLALRDHPQKVEETAESFGMKWVLLMGDQNIALKYDVTKGVPTTIFLDRNGNEVMRLIGAHPYDALKRGFDAIT
jgi:thiol-disulfide isomerase/thioredoxin